MLPSGSLLDTAARAGSRLHRLTSVLAFAQAEEKAGVRCAQLMLRRRVGAACKLLLHEHLKQRRVEFFCSSSAEVQHGVGGGTSRLSQQAQSSPTCVPRGLPFVLEAGEGCPGRAAPPDRRSARSRPAGSPGPAPPRGVTAWPCPGNGADAAAARGPRPAAPRGPRALPLGAAARRHHERPAAGVSGAAGAGPGARRGARRRRGEAPVPSPPRPAVSGSPRLQPAGRLCRGRRGTG